MAQLMIVQPHVSNTTYRRLRQAGGVPCDDLLRLLENLLNSTRATAPGTGTDFVVINSRT